MMIEAQTLPPLLARKYIERFGHMMLVQPIHSHMSPQQAEALLQQLQLQAKNNAWLYQPVHLMPVQSHYAIVYEDFLGQSLVSYDLQLLSIHEVLQIALELTNACVAFHQQGETMEYLTPSFIAIQPTSKKVKLFAPSLMKREHAHLQQHVHNGQVRELVYIAPEQTGRINSEMDERTDLYILGTILFELVTRQPLFQADNVIDALFYVLTKTPDEALLKEACPLVMLRQIIVKLLRKDKEERYQTAAGLRQDLLKVMELLIEGAFAESFTLGEHDSTIQPLFSSKLYGRDTERFVLQQAYRRAKAGEKEIVFIQGLSGSGKSALAKSLMQQVIEDQSYFLETKFEQRQNSHSFQPIIELLRSLLKQTFLEGEASIQKIRNDLLQQDFLLTDSLLQLIPELGWFTDDKFRVMQENTPYTLQLHALLFASIEKILTIYTTQQKQLVFFIDDIQWASEDALSILQQIYTLFEGGYVLLILANREETGAVNHTVLLWQKELPSFTSIHVRLLTLDAVFSYVSDVLQTTSPTAKSIAQRIFHMTQGNALFVQEVFRTFIQDKTVYYDNEKQQWHYNQEKLQQTIKNTDLFSFIESRLHALSQDAMALLQIAACLGHQFDFYLLSKLTNQPDYKVLLSLEELIANGFIVALDRQFHLTQTLPAPPMPLHTFQFHFAHDRIQQSAYEMLAYNLRLQTHLNISQLYIQDESLGNPLQTIVHHLNQCMPLLSPKEQQQLAVWNYELGMKAKAAGLYTNARHFFTESLRLLQANHWTTLREHSLNLYIELGECEYLVGNYTQSKQYIYEALQNTKTKLEQLKIYRLMSFIFIEEHNNEMELDSGLKALELCQMNIQLEPSKWQVAKEFMLVKIALHNRTDEQLLQLAPIENEEIDVLIQIIINFIGNSFRKSQNLTGMLMLRLLRLQLKYGAATESAIVFINYALILISGFNNTKEALRFGNLAVRLADESKNTYIKARVHFIHSIFLNHWQHDYESSIQKMRIVQQYEEQLGLYYNLTVVSCFLCNAKLLDGRPLQEITKEMAYQKTIYSKYSSPLAQDFLDELAHWISALQTTHAKINWHAPITLKNEETVVSMHYILRLRMAYLYKNDTQLNILLHKLTRQSSEVFSLPTTPTYHFFRTLCYFDFLNGKMQHHFSPKALRNDIAKSFQHFKAWAKQAPHQYEHYYMGLLAEKWLYKKQWKKAIQAFNNAIQLAKIYDFPHDEAILHERLAKLYIAQHEQKKATYHILQGIEKLEQWGATAIATQWKEAYADYLPARSHTAQSVLPYDIINLFNATHLLANEEFHMEQMLQQILQLILKQCNATTGSFIRMHNKQYQLLSYIKSERSPQASTQALQVTAALKTILEYVQHTNEPLVIGNLEKDRAFMHIQRSTKSILCMPIKYKGKTQAFLYLENELLFNAFHHVQLELLSLITTQLAVTLENAEIYNDLENRVKERTAKLDEMNIFLKDANERLAINEQERKKLLQSISHELRSPLTSTLGYIESILDGVVQDRQQQRHYLQRSRERLISLNRLIQDLFDLAKLEAGRMDFTYTKIAVHEFFEQFAYRFEGNVLDAHLSYSASGNLPTNCYVLVDLLRIEQVISNFISNAIKYTNEGRISLKMFVEHNELFCIVEDSGIGIPENELPFIFDSYFRASNSQALNSHGIGLAICKEIITKHNGAIFADSNASGSRFYFTLPCSSL